MPLPDTIRLVLLDLASTVRRGLPYCGLEALWMTLGFRWHRWAMRPVPLMSWVRQPHWTNVFTKQARTVFWRMGLLRCNRWSCQAPVWILWIHMFSLESPWGPNVMADLCKSHLQCILSRGPAKMHTLLTAVVCSFSNACTPSSLSYKVNTVGIPCDRTHSSSSVLRKTGQRVAGILAQEDPQVLRSTSGRFDA